MVDKICLRLFDTYFLFFQILQGVLSLALFIHNFVIKARALIIYSREAIKTLAIVKNT
jgi:hypothetical protein